MMEFPDFGFLQFFKNDGSRLDALLIICITLIICILGVTIIRTIGKDRRHKREVDAAKAKPRAIIKGRQGELFGEEFDLDD